MSAFIEELNGICNHLANFACKQLHSSDNITVMVLIFQKWLDANVPIETATVEEVPKEEYVEVQNVPELVSKYGRNIRHWDSQVNLDSVSSWDEVVFQHIQEPYRELFLKTPSSYSAGVHNQRNESEYLSASIYCNNADQYNQGLQKQVVDKLTLPAGRIYHSQSKSSDEGSNKKASESCNNIGKSRPTSGTLNFNMNEETGLQSPASLARELDSIMMSPSPAPSKQRPPTSFHPLPKQKPLANSTVAALSYTNTTSADPIDEDMDFLLDDRNF